MPATPQLAKQPKKRIAIKSSSPVEKNAQPPADGWLGTVRQSLGQSQAKVAGKIGIKRQAYANFEAGEVRFTISLASLRRAARAMDHDLVYYLVPRTGATASPATATHRRNPSANDRKDAVEQFVVQAERSADALPLQLL